MLSNRYNKKAQIFVISVVIAVTVALTTSYILLHYMFKEINPDQHLGNYQSAMIDAMAQGDKTMLYIDQASKMAVANAFDEYIYGNPQPSMNVEGGDTESKYCGSYVYKLWNVADKDCYPDYASQDFELSKLINSHLAELTYLRESNDEYLILDRILRENIDYRYSYKTGDGSTTIIATTSDEYDIDIFLNEKIATDSEILEYLSNKDAFSGQMIWPLAKNFQVASCFGYRGRISEMASLNHPGIDISAPKGTPVLAAASGTVERKLYPDWGKIVLDHGSGLKTAYIHMDTIAEGITVGDKVQQGQIIGYVGGRGANSADDYSPHLHFEVVSTTVNLDADYKGVNAVVKGLYVNPICFFNEADIQQNVIFNMQSKACNSICSEDGSKCVAPESGDITNVPYKFCDVYTGIISQEGICPKSNKIDWKIIDVKLSSTTLTSDQILKIDMNVENKDESCVSVKQDLKFITNDDASRPDYTIQSSSVAVYKATDSERYKALNTIICKFSSDYDIVTKEQLAGNCVLWIPKSGTARYTLESRALDGNGHTEIYSNQRITFSVRKVAVESYVPQTIPTANNAQLSASERSKFEKTKQNIENLNIMEYISEQALKEGISKELILGIITQESGGDMYAGSPAGAYGLMQVVKSTFDGTRFQNKCTWEEYKKDAQCQIRAGIAVLKQKNTEIQGRTLYYTCNTNCRGTNSRGEDGYWSSCSRGCSQTDCMGPVKKTYSGWDAALRRYNGGGD
ncbi:MAG: peptidoglycan DD-metalloendopeptidase family protein, partial [Candidatus Woesearchaeota archaeon]